MYKVPALYLVSECKPLFHIARFNAGCPGSYASQTATAESMKSQLFQQFAAKYFRLDGMTSNRKTAQAGDGTKTLMNELSIIKPLGIDSTGIRNLYVLGEVISRITLIIVPAVSKREA